MTNKFKVQIERVENGYIITSTFDGTSFGDFTTTTFIKQEVNDAVEIALKHISKASVMFSTMDDKGSL